MLDEGICRIYSLLSIVLFFLYWLLKGKICVFGTVTFNKEMEVSMKSTSWYQIVVCVLLGAMIAGCQAELKPEVVREVERPEPKVTEEGYTIEPRTVRAWVEDIEREAMAASHIVKLGDFQFILGMSISADGNTLVFSLAERLKDEKGDEKWLANLRSVQTTGGGITEITSGQWLDTSPVFTSNGYLFFASDRLRKRSMDIFRISSEKTGAIAVIRQTSEGVNYEPSVANNGVIAFTYKPIYPGKLPSSEQVWSLGGENQYPTQLREGSMPAISPDGTQIAYIGPDKQLWKVPINGQNPVQLMSTPIQKEGKKHPAWSPDGKYILYASDVGKDSKDESNYDIWMIREDGTNTRQLTTNGSVDDFPVVSPDQKYIYFVSNRGFKEGIWRIPFPVSD
jgi:dipeptidyl aminopeptidase/acylaminoacyl peptidase